MKNGYKIILVALLILVLYVGISQKTYFNRFEYVEADVIDVVGDNIWIGKDCEVVVGSISPERVEAIELGEEKELGPRPFIYDNFVDVLNFYDVTLEAVLVKEVENKNFKSDMIFVSDSEVLFVDSRPSDAVALALRMDVPIYVHKDLLEEVGINYCELVR